MTEYLFLTRRLGCRRLATTDYDALYGVYSDGEAMRWVGDGKPITHAQCKLWIRVTGENYARRGYGMFALEERATGNVIGFCGLVHPDNQPEPEIKYALLRSCWRRGLASEVVPSLLSYGAAKHGMNRIIATVAPENAASLRVLAKAGMRFVDTRADADGSITHVYEWLPRESENRG